MIGATVTSVKATAVALRGLLIDQGYLAENAVLADSFEPANAAPHLDLPIHDDKELIAPLFASLKIVLPFAKKRIGNSRRTRRLKSTSSSDISTPCPSRPGRTPPPASPQPPAAFCSPRHGRFEATKA